MKEVCENTSIAFLINHSSRSCPTLELPWDFFQLTAISIFKSYSEGEASVSHTTRLRKNLSFTHEHTELTKKPLKLQIRPWEFNKGHSITTVSPVTLTAWGMGGRQGQRLTL
jgi:hypothetical protein